MEFSLKKITIFPLIVCIKFYQIAISPLLGSNCRFQPTCSEYMKESLEEYGIFKGFWFGIKRLCRCHPWGGSGFDPVPKK